MGVLGTNQLDIKLDFDDVRFRGGCLGLGTAGMIVMNEHTDMVRALRNCVRFYSHESCGQCTPCREGSAWMRKMLDRIVAGDGRAKDIDMLMELEKTVGMHARHHHLRPGRRHQLGDADVHQQVLRGVRGRLPGHAGDRRGRC